MVLDVRPRGKNLLALFRGRVPRNEKRILECVLAELDYRYPNYEKICWALVYAARLLLLKDAGSQIEKRIADSRILYGLDGAVIALCGSSDNILGKYVLREIELLPEDVVKQVLLSLQMRERRKPLRALLALSLFILAQNLAHEHSIVIPREFPDFLKNLLPNTNDVLFVIEHWALRCATNNSPAMQAS